jgi:cytochrome b subunit of formate dehydrogenase
MWSADPPRMTAPPGRGPEFRNLDPVRAELALPRRLVTTRVFIVLGCLSLRLALAAEVPVEKTQESAANSSTACLECHSDGKLKMKKAGHVMSLFADQTLLAKSAHRSLDCIDCHEGFDAEKLPHQTPLKPVDCAACHEDTGRKHCFHRRLALSPAPKGDDTACAACHGTHAVAPLKSADFPFARAQQTDACGRCHQPARDQFLASAHAKALAAGMIEAPACLDCHRLPVARRPEDKLQIELKLAQTTLCESCHLKKSEVGARTLRGSKFVSSFDKSVHGAALQRGIVDAANCVDCHGSHEMNQAMVAGSRVNKAHLPGTCARCHKTQTAEYNFSVHAVALRKGNLDSPVCTDCHGEHDILAHTNPEAPVYARNVAQDVCASCHASVRLTKKYGLAADSFQTFSDSYHGLAGRGGATAVVNCASCHSSHAIKSHLDPTSTTYQDNLVVTCGQCHTGVNKRFTTGRVHVSPEQRAESPILYWIANIYVILIFLVIGGMTLHNLLDFVHKLLRKLAMEKGEIPEEPVAHRLYLRLTVHERLQHAALALSFILLVLTGFMLRYPEAWWVVGIRSVSSSAFVARGLLHRLAGVVLIAAGLWHLGYLGFTPKGRRLFLDLLPAWRDLTDPWKVLRHNLGFAPEKPKFDRFSYIEKAEYWALIWGTVLMGVTGVILWFDNTSMGLFTKLGFDISRTVHFYEAVLATLAILVWHFYFVIFNPDIYPMNLAWLTGHVSEREMIEDHPLELERLKQGEQAEKPAPAPKPDSSPDKPAS